MVNRAGSRKLGKWRSQPFKTQLRKGGKFHFTTKTRLMERVGSGIGWKKGEAGCGKREVGNRKWKVGSSRKRKVSGRRQGVGSKR